jgi:hypothetical protein
MAAAGLVIPAIVKVPAVELASAQLAPTRVTVTVCAVVDPVAVQLVNPLVKAIVGVAGMLKPEGNTTEMVLPTTRWPVAEGVKPSVHVVFAWAASDPPAKATAVGEVAGPIVTPAPGLAAVTSWEVEMLKLVAG